MNKNTYYNKILSNKKMTGNPTFFFYYHTPMHFYENPLYEPKVWDLIDEYYDINLSVIMQEHKEGLLSCHVLDDRMYVVEKIDNNNPPQGDQTQIKVSFKEQITIFGKYFKLPKIHCLYHMFTGWVDDD